MNEKSLTLFAILALAAALSASAECPSSVQDDALAQLTVERGHIMTFGFEGDAVAQRGMLWLCVYDRESGEPIDGLRFDVIPYEGKVHGRGPRPSDLQYYNPEGGTLETAGPVLQLETSPSGKILQRHLPQGDYALVPDWETTVANDIAVDFVAISTLAVDMPAGRIVSASGP